MELSSGPAAAARVHAAFTPVWQQECEPVTRQIFRKLSRQDREDATQEVALRLSRVFPEKLAIISAELAAGRPSPMCWAAYTNIVCQHVLADFYKDRRKRIDDPELCQSLDRFRTGARRYRRDDETFPDSLIESDLVADPRATADPLAWVTTGDLSSLIRHTVAALPAQQRTVLRAHLFGATDKEAAAQAGLPESTAYRRRVAATLSLQTALHAAGFALSYPLGAPHRRTKQRLGVQGNNRAPAQRERRALGGGGQGAQALGSG